MKIEYKGVSMDVTEDVLNMRRMCDWFLCPDIGSQSIECKNCPLSKDNVPADCLGQVSKDQAYAYICGLQGDKTDGYNGL
jgi:hypothetical protein